MLTDKRGPSHDMLQHVMFAHVIKKSAVQFFYIMFHIRRLLDLSCHHWYV